jgi:kynureninase
LTLFEEAGLENIWAKQQALKQFLLQNLPKSPDYKVITPLGFGSQVSLYFHEIGEAEKMYAYLHAQAIETDLRKPNVLRIAPVPLYNSFEDIAELLSVLENR